MVKNLSYGIVDGPKEQAAQLVVAFEQPIGYGQRLAAGVVTDGCTTH